MANVKLQWIGHACFRIETSDGTVIITDPYEEKVPYKAPEGPAHIVTVSHDHFDHNAVERVKGSPQVVRGIGEQTVRGITFRGIPAFHDQKGGRDRGQDVIFRFAADGVTLAHFGDLGHTLNAEQLRPLQDVEVALLPVGGHFTIGAKEASEVVRSLPKLKVVIPMHYRTEVVKDWPIRPVEEFLDEVGLPIVRLEKSEVKIIPDVLPATKEVWVLNYA
ncbi:MAG TPA: MBL fold metallo-hydrolase [Candidatus Acetothermia bacterium]|nr:MBL fold metallo-hydrolase [Candidatus Acetothermia bacterium]